MSVVVTPAMSDQRAQEIAAGFDLRALPADFHANPYRSTTLCAPTNR
jgi:hypothetical protein